MSTILNTHIKNIVMTFKSYTDKNFHFKLATRQTRIFKSLPIRLEYLNSSKKLSFVLECSKNIRVLKYKCILHTSLVVLQLLQCLLSSTNTFNREQSAFDKIFGWLTFQILMTTSIFLHICRINGPIFESYLNNILSTSNNIANNTLNLGRLTSFKVKLKLLAIPIILFSGHVFGPTLVFGFHWKNQCKSSFVGYILLEECYSNVSVGSLDILTITRLWFAKIVAFILNICMWNLGGSCAGFVVTVCYIISPIIQQEFIQFMRIQLNDIENVYSKLRIYRQIQILNTLYNETQKIALGAMMICGTLGVSISLAFLVSSLNGGHSKANILVFTTYGMSICNCTFALVIVLGGMVAVSFESEKYLKDVSKLELRQISREKRLWIRRHWRSCAKVKIYFGANNFLENLTPLRCLDWAVNLAVQILLVADVK